MAADAPTVHTASLLADKVVISIVCVDGDLRDYYFTNVTQALRHELSVGEVLVTQAEKDVSQDSVAALQDRCKKQVEQFVEWQRDADKDRAELVCRHKKELADLQIKLNSEHRLVAQRADSQLKEAQALIDKNRALKTQVGELEKQRTALERVGDALRQTLAEKTAAVQAAIAKDLRQDAEVADLRKELGALREEQELYQEELRRLESVVGEKEKLRNDAIRTLAEAEKVIKPLTTAIESLRLAVSTTPLTAVVASMEKVPAPAQPESIQQLETLLASYQYQRARAIEAAQRYREVIDPLERSLEDNRVIAAHSKAPGLDQVRDNLLQQLEQPRIDYDRLMNGANLLAVAEETVEARLNALKVLSQPLSDEVLAGPDAVLNRPMETLQPTIEAVPNTAPEPGIDVVALAQRAQAHGLSVMAYLTVCFLDIIPLRRSGIARLFTAARKVGFVTIDPVDRDIDGGDLKGNKALSKYLYIATKLPSMTRNNYGRTQTDLDDNPLDTEQRKAFIKAFEELAPPPRKSKNA